MTVKISFMIWFIVLYSLVGVYQRFAVTYSLHLQNIKERKLSYNPQHKYFRDLE
jgi:hypothetical protein